MKKFYALIFLAAVVLSLASCDAKKDTDNSIYDNFISEVNQDFYVIRFKNKKPFLIYNKKYFEMEEKNSP